MFLQLPNISFCLLKQIILGQKPLLITYTNLDWMEKTRFIQKSKKKIEMKEVGKNFIVFVTHFFPQSQPNIFSFSLKYSIFFSTKKLCYLNIFVRHYVLICFIKHFIFTKKTKWNKEKFNPFFKYKMYQKFIIQNIWKKQKSQEIAPFKKSQFYFYRYIKVLKPYSNS